MLSYHPGLHPVKRHLRIFFAIFWSQEQFWRNWQLSAEEMVSNDFRCYTGDSGVIGGSDLVAALQVAPNPKTPPIRLPLLQAAVAPSDSSASA
ncbi:MAG TPA: hypothetical protein VFH85_04300 [Gammaproteobacteria bacterium]|nr:hypothetical protein [Gammaproteobacteria bacterium]